MKAKTSPFQRKKNFKVDEVAITEFYKVTDNIYGAEIIRDLNKKADYDSALRFLATVERFADNDKPIPAWVTRA